MSEKDKEHPEEKSARRKRGKIETREMGPSGVF
jgi:hypothetical protein